jgi:hypothetical protein
MNGFNRISLSLLLGALVAPTLITGANASTEKILPSVLSVNDHAHTATLPLYRGEFHGKSVWYVITDASDRAAAERNHVVYSPSLANIGTASTQHVAYKNGVPQFDGIPDFRPTRSYIASAGGFPPKTATPGSVGDAEYSPFITTSTTDGVFNAPVVAVGDGPFDVTTHVNTEDRVVAIDTKAKTVTIALAQGFVNDRPVLYLSTEASDPVAAAVERATYVPKLAKANAGAAIGIGVFAAGLQTGATPQGLAYLALRTPLSSDATASNAATIGSPFNVLSLVPNVANLYGPQGYSPLWSVQVVGSPQSKRVTNFADFNALGAKAAGFVVNCPVVAFGG